MNQVVAEDLASPSVREYSLGVTKRLGSKGLARVDGMYRKWQGFYTSRVDMGTGKVSDPAGRRFDLELIVNSDDVERTYKGVKFQLQYRFLRNLTLGGNYTASARRPRSSPGSWWTTSSTAPPRTTWATAPSTPRRARTRRGR